MKYGLEPLSYELGGIGDIKKKTLRFSAYKKESKGSDILINPAYSIGDPVRMTDGYPVSSQELLFRLCNLYIELRDHCIEEQADILIDWCTANVHPYYNYGNVDFSKRQGKEQEEILDCFVNVIGSYEISVRAMVKDVSRLYEDMVAMRTLTLLLDGEDAAAKAYYIKSDDFFGESLYDKWQAAEVGNRQSVADKFFAKLPKFTMAMEIDPKTSRPVFLPQIASAIDSAYYALMRLTVVNAGTLDDWGGKNNIAFCEVCGRMFVSHHGQKYCGAPECVSEKNRLKTRAYRERKKSTTEAK